MFPTLPPPTFRMIVVNQGNLSVSEDTARCTSSRPRGAGGGVSGKASEAPTVHGTALYHKTSLIQKVRGAKMEKS